MNRKSVNDSGAEDKGKTADSQLKNDADVDSFQQNVEMDLDNMPAGLVAFARQQTNQQKDFDNKRKGGFNSYMGQVEGKLVAYESRVKNKMAKLKTTVNTLEETFTTWESKGKM